MCSFKTKLLFSAFLASDCRGNFNLAAFVIRKIYRRDDQTQQNRVIFVEELSHAGRQQGDQAVAAMFVCLNTHRRF